MIDLNNIAKDMLAIAKKREANGANIKTDNLSMLKHTGTEVVEATEAYCKCWSVDKPEKSEVKRKFASELADIIACTLIICANDGIDMEVALMMCLKKNEARAEGKGDKK